jgi:hypothetical protein
LTLSQSADVSDPDGHVAIPIRVVRADHHVRGYRSGEGELA